VNELVCVRVDDECNAPSSLVRSFTYDDAASNEAGHVRRLERGSVLVHVREKSPLCATTCQLRRRRRGCDRSAGSSPLVTCLVGERQPCVVLITCVVLSHTSSSGNLGRRKKRRGTQKVVTQRHVDGHMPPTVKTYIMLAIPSTMGYCRPVSGQMSVPFIT